MCGCENEPEMNLQETVNHANCKTHLTQRENLQCWMNSVYICEGIICEPHHLVQLANKSRHFWQANGSLPSCFKVDINLSNLTIFQMFENRTFWKLGNILIKLHCKSNLGQIRESALNVHLKEPIQRADSKSRLVCERRLHIRLSWLFYF